MGMLGQYVMVDEDTLERMMEMDGARLLDFYRKALAAGKHVIFSIV
ncbi:hypothetical protein MKZ24_14715 [Paenibacillus sp. FSL R7-0297]|nr:hypothetical protein [Paenibacillus sp. FSL R5-0912]